jgi:hypothetical protein
LLTLKNTIQKIIDNELQQVVNRVFSLQMLNGNCVLSVVGSTNHKTKSVDEVINLFFKIAEMAPGTYGLLYLYDDEDKDGKNDEFQVYKVAKGEVTVEKDTLLSPYEAHISFKRT